MRIEIQQNYDSKKRNTTFVTADSSWEGAPMGPGSVDPAKIDILNCIKGFYTVI
jgi:hypothetical protein